MGNCRAQDRWCLNNASLLDFLYRLDRPGFTSNSSGTIEAWTIHHNPASITTNIRIIIENKIARGIGSFMGTEADDFEDDNSSNAIIANPAMEYELSPWNFWMAAQPLPGQGLEDASHLSSISYTKFTDFSIPHSLEYGMRMRNLTSLQLLDFLREQLAEPSPVDMVATPIP